MESRFRWGILGLGDGEFGDVVERVGWEDTDLSLVICV